MHLELAVRRVKWLQAIVKCPGQHRQFVAVAWGTLVVTGTDWTEEVLALTDRGHLAPTASKLAFAFEEAWLYYEGVSGTKALFETWDSFQRSWMALLLSAALRRELQALDPRVLLAAFATDHQFAAQCEEKELACLETEKAKAWCCGLGLGEGRACQATFPTRSQLISHQVHKHEVLHPIKTCVVTNYCVNCRSSFASIVTAKQHLCNAYLYGRCIVDQAVAKWPTNFEDVGVDCHLCGKSFHSSEQLLLAST